MCPKCGGVITPGDIFCSHCGYALVAQPIHIGQQINIILISLLLPPFGLVYFFKYFKSENSSNKRIGYIAGVLTIVSTIFVTWTTIGVWQGIQQTFSQYPSLSY